MKYCEWIKEEGMPGQASISMYRKIFNEEFNIGTFQPKSNQCLQCAKWKHATTQEKAEMAASHTLHLENRDVSQARKNADRDEAQAQLPGQMKICVASFDMQKILTIPKSEVSAFFYRNKISLLNFTIFNMGPKLGICHLWNETMAKKSSSEVSTCVYFFMERTCEENPEVEEFRFSSDNPTSQNKNRFHYAMYRLSSTKFNVKIVHRFLEVGHTHMEVDSMHAAIERKVKYEEIFDENEWVDHIKNSKKSSDDNPANAYEIIKVGEDLQVLSFKQLVEAQNWKYDTERKEIKWTNVKEIHFDPTTPKLVSIKYDYNGDFITLDTSKKGRPVNLKTYKPPNAYMYRFPLPQNKVEDIKFLLKCGAIPSKYHSYYQGLLDVSEGDEVFESEEACGEDCICCEDGNEDANEEDIIQE